MLEKQRRRFSCSVPVSRPFSALSPATMVDLGLFGSLLVVVLGFVAVFCFFIGRNKSKNDGSATSTTTTTLYNGESRSKDGNEDVDIIIVGAGVAGAALAHTLGKVLFLSL